jgi:RimJ/RimL family protein N-acetyltransferase
MRKVITENQEELRNWISGVLGTKFGKETMCIGQEIDGKVMAVIAYTNFQENSCCMHVASIVPNWISKNLLWAAFDYPFNSLKVKVILAVVASTNDEALKLDRHLGFVDKAYIEDAHMDGDLVILAMRRENCRWLDIKTPLKGD